MLVSEISEPHLRTGSSHRMLVPALSTQCSYHISVPNACTRSPYPVYVGTILPGYTCFS